MAVGQLPLPAQLLEHGPQGPHLGLGQLGQKAILKALAQHVEIPRQPQSAHPFSQALVVDRRRQLQGRFELHHRGAQPAHGDPHLMEGLGSLALGNRCLQLHQLGDLPLHQIAGKPAVAQGWGTWLEHHAELSGRRVS